MRTVAIINQKGGCGKTTVSINLASALAAKGYRTLLVDMDPQSHCAVGLAVPEEQIEQSVYDVLIGNARGEPLRMKEILWQISDRFELAPSSIDLAAFESQMSGIIDRENCLSSVLREIQEEYDYVVIDCPPSVGLLTFNALRAATDVVVPVEMGYFSLHGLSKQLETLQVLSEQCRQKVNVMVLASMYDIRTKMGREILAELRKHFGERMFQTVVNFNTKLKEAASLGQPISEYDPASKGYKDFLNLAEELIGTDTLVHKAELVDTLEARIQTISASAEELLATIKEPQPAPAAAEIAQPAAATAEVEPAKTPPQVQRTFEEKVADFYGVRQEDGSVVFSTLYPRAKRVEIAGDFNDWIPEQTPMQMASENGKWVTKLSLGKGTYRYRLVVDGQWQQDPYNENAEPNPFGELNSVLHVQ
jgi:chromosome partitioning protein